MFTKKKDILHKRLPLNICQIFEDINYNQLYVYWGKYIVHVYISFGEFFFLSSCQSSVERLKKIKHIRQFKG